MIKISPSMLAADFINFERDIRAVEAAGADMLHIDVMDGNFVVPISFGQDTISALRKVSNLFFDVHIMVNNPWHHIDSLIACGADSITIHYESGGDIPKMLKRIREQGCRCALAINPPTPWEVMLPYMDMLDMALVMSVNPGYGGQKYIPSSTDKLRALRNHIDTHGLSCALEIDGGVNASTIQTVLDAGADTIVAGSYVFKAPDMAEAIRFLRKPN